jgi:DNA-binding NtrC family response regulator
MMSTPLRILMVEDSEQDSRLFLRELRQGGYESQSLRVECAAELTSAQAAQEWDVIICDYSLPQFTGLDSLKLVQATGRDLPFILVSGAVGEDQAVAVMKAGAHDTLC